jgi:S-adenosylmethionine/arginine decarboxylase-like enzyme
MKLLIHRKPFNCAMVDEKISHSSNKPMELTHKHLILRGEVADTPLLQDLQFLRNWTESLIEVVGMEILIPPVAAYCDKVRNRGATVLAGLTTSSITLHIWDDADPPVIQFDLYSCAPFVIDDVLSKINVFSLGRYEYYLLNRDQFMSHSARIGLYPESRSVPI